MSLMAMRTVLILSLGSLFVLPLHAQSQDEPFFQISRQVEVAPDTVVEAATVVAEEKKYLRQVSPAGDPTALIAGDVLLRIDETPITLHLQRSNDYTEARLVSHKLDVSERTKQQAKAFLEKVIDRATSKHG